MRQHAIPQNVLDVEFKLFTRFTLKEFMYLAIGVGSGGIFMYLSAKGDLPGIVGIPLFVILAGAGAFLGLVPINDQDADVFITNYFNAINKPTQRVWLNESMKEKRNKPDLNTEDEKKKIVVGNKIAEAETKNIQYSEEPGDDILESKDSNPVQPIQEQRTFVQSTPTPSVQSNNDILTITEQNISNYQFNIKSVDRLPGNINIWLCTRENQPLTNVNTYLKDQSGKIMYANKTGPNGYFLSNRVYPNGIYIIEFETPLYRIKPIKLIISDSISKLPLKIIAN